MKKLYFLMIVLLFVLTCSNTYKQSIKHNTKLFVSEKVQDTLLLFLNTIDSIPNSDNFPTNYIIELKNKHILKFKAIPSIYILFNVKTRKETTWKILKGGCKINNKNVLVYSDIKNTSNFINLDKLSIDFAKNIYDLMLEIENDSNEYERNVIPHIEWVYKIHSVDSLKLLSKRSK